MRCAECDCKNGGYECNWFKTPHREAYLVGYDTALLNFAELINNARSNGERQHWDTELLDQLLQISNNLTPEDILKT